MKPIKQLNKLTDADLTLMRLMKFFENKDVFTDAPVPGRIIAWDYCPTLGYMGLCISYRLNSFQCSSFYGGFKLDNIYNIISTQRNRYVHFSKMIPKSKTYYCKWLMLSRRCEMDAFFRRNKIIDSLKDKFYLLEL